MKIIYYLFICIVYHALLQPQGVDWPDEPVQAPISGLGLLIATGAALAYKKFKK
tara:strand:+ start:450 stop:611 length:162 start_codon:yes stop_codon:yes gene_type:complete